MIPLSVSRSEPGFRLRIHWLKKLDLQEEKTQQRRGNLFSNRPRQLIWETVPLRKENLNILRTVDQGFELTGTLRYSTSLYPMTNQHGAMTSSGSLSQTWKNSEGPPTSRAPHVFGWGLLWDCIASHLLSLPNSISFLPQVSIADTLHTEYPAN